MNNIENERLSAELERDKHKWKIRRRIAITSFLLLIVSLVFYFATPKLFSADEAKILAEFNSIVITIISAFVGIILTYYGTVAYTDGKISISNKNNN